MRVVVTGGAGFIGANLVHALDARPWVSDVTVLDDLSTGRTENLAGSTATFIEGTILEDADLDAAMAGADAVVHLAARPSVPRSIEDPLRSHDVNATGTIRVLEAARRADVSHVIVASSSSVYGDAEVLPKHEQLPTAPRSPYAASKLAGESYALAYGACFDQSVLALRFFNVFGPLQPADHAYAAVIPAFVSAAVAGRPLPVHGDGLQTRDFTYVGSVVEVISAALRNGTTHDGPVNLAFGTRRTLQSVIEELSEILGHPLEIEHMPARPGDVRHSQAGTDRLLELFADTQPVPFGEGLRATVAWFQALAADGDDPRDRATPEISSAGQRT